MTTSFRPFDPFQVYTDLTGALASGGTLHFYAAGTTTDADVFGDNALTVNNGPTVAIGSDGRAVDDIWCDGTKSYRCRVYASDATLIADRDNIAMQVSGTTLPTPVDGEFLVGASGLWVTAAIRQALDPTGQANKLEGSDGTNQVWVDKPSDGSDGTSTQADVTVTSTSVKWSNGTGDLFFIQTGTGTAAATGTINTGATISFPVAFKAIAAVIISPTNDATGSGYLPTWSVNTKTTTGASVEFGTNGANPGVHFATTQNFDWIAFGTVAS